MRRSAPSLREAFRQAFAELAPDQRTAFGYSGRWKKTTLVRRPPNGVDVLICSCLLMQLKLDPPPDSGGPPEQGVAELMEALKGSIERARTTGFSPARVTRRTLPQRVREPL